MCVCVCVCVCVLLAFLVTFILINSFEDTHHQSKGCRLASLGPRSLGSSPLGP